MGNIKAINLRIQSIREAVENKLINIYHLNTKNMMADIGTKALSPALFQHLSDYILGVKPLLELMELPEFSDLPTLKILHFCITTNRK